MTDGRDVLTADLLRAWVAGALERLGRHRDALDALNVFPVADSDTGTNLTLTLAEADEAMADLPPGASAARVGVALARGALVGARGNSGVIVSQYLGALLRHWDGDLAAALDSAAGAAYAAVAEPVEGTVLTIGRAVADGARAATDGYRSTADLRQVLGAGVSAGYDALVSTPQLLAPLDRAGVVDAGALGLLLVLDALLAALGVPVGERAVELLAARPSGPGPVTDCGEGGEFEVMFLVNGTEPLVSDEPVADGLAAALSAHGQSVAVVGGHGLWQAHVHTDHPLAVLELDPPAGTRSEQYRIRHLASQAGVHGPHRPALGLVAVTSATGLVPDLARSGAVVVLVAPGGRAGPELGRAVADTGAAHVLVLAAAELDEPTVTRRAGAGAGLDVVTGLTEAQLVTGAATLVSLDPALGDAALLGLVWDAVHRVQTVRLAAPDGPALLEAVRRLVAGGAGLVTVLAGAHLPGPVLDVLGQGLDLPAEIVVHPAALPGQDVVLGAE